MADSTVREIINGALPNIRIIILAHKTTLISWDEQQNMLHAWRLLEGSLDRYINVGAKALMAKYTVPELVEFAKAFVFDNTLHG